jgi:hypothetical protein
MMTNRFYKIIVFYTFFTAAVTSLQAQHIDSLLSILDENYPQEKIHLHMDKLNYNPGETSPQHLVKPAMQNW